MEEGRILKFTLTKSEISELSLRLAMDCILMTKTIWLFLALLVFVPSMMSPSADLSLAEVLRILLGNAGLYGTIILAYAVMRYLGFSRFCKKNGFLEERVYRLEHGSLIYQGDGSSLDGSRFTNVSETGRLLLLKRPVSKNSFQFFVFPKRIFDSREDMQELLAYLQKPQSFYEEPPADTGQADGQYHFSFSLTVDDFAHVYTQVVRIIRNQSPSLLNARTLLFLVIPLAFLISSCVDMMINGDLVTGILFMSAGILGLVYLLFKTTEVREDTYRKLIRGKRLPVNESGMWDMLFAGDIIRLKHDQDTFQRQWDTYTNLFETIDTYFLVRINGKRVEQYVFLPKWAFRDQEEQDGFLNLCSTKGLEKQYLCIREAEDPEGAAARLRGRNAVLVTLTLLLFFLSIASVLIRPVLMVLMRYAR